MALDCIEPIRSDSDVPPPSRNNGGPRQLTTMCIRNIFDIIMMNERRSRSEDGGGTNNTTTTDARTTTTAAAFLPKYLSHIVRHYYDDFYISRSFETQLIVQLMAEGFLPIATKGYLLPKLHIERCVLQLNPQSKLHISRSTRKKSKSFSISVNKCFDDVVAGCHRQQ